jgi:hypothetical protein
MKAILLIVFLGLIIGTFGAYTRADISGLHVCGNRICNGAGQVIRLIVVDRSGTEFTCIQNRVKS